LFVCLRKENEMEKEREREKKESMMITTPDINIYMEPMNDSTCLKGKERERVCVCVFVYLCL